VVSIPGLARKALSHLREGLYWQHSLLLSFCETLLFIYLFTLSLGPRLRGPPRWTSIAHNDLRLIGKLLPGGNKGVILHRAACAMIVLSRNIAPIFVNNLVMDASDFRKKPVRGLVDDIARQVKVGRTFISVKGAKVFYRVLCCCLCCCRCCCCCCMRMKGNGE